MYRPNRASTAMTRNSYSPQIFSNQKLSKKQKQQQYLTPRTQSFSAQSSRNQNQQLKIKSQTMKTQLKMQSKVPVMTSHFREEELKTRINKLGLQGFMKQIVLPEKMTDPQFSSKVIHALNRTYIEDQVQYQKAQFRPSFGKKCLRDSRRLQNPRVDWNPEKDLMQNQFKEFDYHIPSAMFPCRKQKTTKLLKSKYKKRDHSSQYSKPTEDIVTKLLHSQSNRQSHSTNLNDPKSSRGQLKSSNSERKRKNLFQLNLSQYSKNSFMRNSKDLKADNESSIYCRRARIYA